MFDFIENAIVSLQSSDMANFLAAARISLLRLP